MDIREQLQQIHEALCEKGYNPVTQLVGYILTEDPTYITNHKGARTIASRIDRDQLLHELVETYISNDKA